MFSRRFTQLKSLGKCNPIVRNSPSIMLASQRSFSTKIIGNKIFSFENAFQTATFSSIQTLSQSTKRNYASLPSGAAFIEMSALSPTMEKGNLISWMKKEGDKIEPGDGLCQVQTDKSTMEMEHQEEGYLAKILVPGGTDDVILGTPIAIFVEKKEDISKVASWAPSGSSDAPKSQASKVEAPSTSSASSSIASSSTSSTSSSTSDRIKASPFAKKLANELNVSLKDVSGTGPEGRIIASDIKEFVPKATTKSTAQATPNVTASASQDFTDIPVTQIRKVIAERLLESKRNIPHYYLTVEIEVDELMRIRALLNKRFEKEGVKLSVNDFILKAAALAARDVPTANSSWQGNFIRQYNNVDMSVAVQTDTGLITPIVFDCDKKGLKEISQNVKELAQKAKDGKLQPHEFQGGTFTVSNLGMYGIKEFSAIINPPQACIMAIGSAQRKVVESEQGFKTVTTINVTLSCDHRVVDGAVGAQYLQTFTKYLSDPVNMLA